MKNRWNTFTGVYLHCIYLYFLPIFYSICAYVPGSDKLLLPRINPFVLIAFTGAIALCFADLMVDVK